MDPNEEARKRRERIMNSSDQLPGDPARADAEENEDFDAGDSGNFGNSVEGHQAGDPLRREEINSSADQLEGDVQRGDDDQHVDEYGEDNPPTRTH